MMQRQCTEHDVKGFDSFLLQQVLHVIVEAACLNIDKMIMKNTVVFAAYLFDQCFVVVDPNNFLKPYSFLNRSSVT